MRNRRRIGPIAIVCLLGSLGGCGLDYYIGLAGGAFGSLARSRPIDWVLLDPRVEESVKVKLRFVREVRRFGIEQAGLNGRTSFELYDDDAAAAANGPIGYSLVACARDSFTPYRWDYPFIGPGEYRGFFSLHEAQAERQRLEAAGYDTYVAAIAGFSTLGFLPDPIRATQLQADEFTLAELVLHELTHTTLYKAGDTRFNETLAQFIGRSAARRFYETTRGVGDPTTAAARRRYDDEDVVDEYIGAVYDALSAYYAMPLSHDEKLAGRQAQFDAAKARFDTEFRPRLSEPERYRASADLPLNNAFVRAAADYRGNEPGYGRVLERLGGDLNAAWAVYRAASGEADSFAFLEAWPDAPP